MPGKKLPKIEGAPVIVDPRPIREIEVECFERFTGGHNFLGWRPWGRDEEGTAVLYCETRGPVQDGHPTTKVQKVKITKEGLVYLRAEYHPADA